MDRVEASGVWRKSTRSNGSGDCTLVAELPDGMIGVKDSKDPDGPVLRFTRSEFRAFILGAKDGEFDNLL